MKVGNLVTFYDALPNTVTHYSRKGVGLVVDIRQRGKIATSDVTVLWSDGDRVLCSQRELRIVNESR